MRRGLLIAGAVLAACGPAAVPGRVQVPGLDRLSGELTAIEVDLPGADPAVVRGPSGWVVVGASIDGGRVVGGTAPECALSRTVSGALAPQTARCAGLLGAYAALDRARAFLISAGAEALPAAPIVADAADAPAGVRYVAQADAYTLAAGAGTGAGRTARRGRPGTSAFARRGTAGRDGARSGVRHLPRAPRGCRHRGVPVAALAPRGASLRLCTRSVTELSAEAETAFPDFAGAGASTVLLRSA